MRNRQGVLLLAELCIVAGALSAFLAVVTLGPIRLMVFLSFGAWLLVGGVVLYVGHTIRNFLRRRGVTQVRFAPGETIFAQGDHGDVAYRIIEGKVEVLRKEGNQEETVVATLSEGAFFGEAALVSDAPRNASVRTLTAVKAVRFGQEDFDSLSALPDFRDTIENLMKARSAASP